MDAPCAVAAAGWWGGRARGGRADAPPARPPLRGSAGARSLLWTCLARCRRPAAWGRLRPAAAAGAVRPRPRHAGSAVDQIRLRVRPELTSLRLDPTLRALCRAWE